MPLATLLAVLPESTQPGLRSRGRIRIAAGAVLLLPLILTSACRIQTDKTSADGNTDHVKISTPLGGLSLRSKDVVAGSLGLPTYPGAHILSKDEDHGNGSQVDLRMGFGPWQMRTWQMRIKVVSYGTPDSREKVMSFYRAALAKYGDVIECNGNQAVGSPSVTKEGLGCDEHEDGKIRASRNKNGVAIYEQDLQLKAGSRLRQHLVGFKKTDDGETKFALIALDLPSAHSEEETN